MEEHGIDDYGPEAVSFANELRRAVKMANQLAYDLDGHERNALLDVD
jgi:hypothetical protein